MEAINTKPGKATGEKTDIVQNLDDWQASDQGMSANKRNLIMATIKEILDLRSRGGVEHRLKSALANPITLIVGTAVRMRCRACDEIWWQGEPEKHLPTCVLREVSRG